MADTLYDYIMDQLGGNISEDELANHVATTLNRAIKDHKQKQDAETAEAARLAKRDATLRECAEKMVSGLSEAYHALFPDEPGVPDADNEELIDLLVDIFKLSAEDTKSAKNSSKKFQNTVNFSIKEPDINFDILKDILGL